MTGAAVYSSSCTRIDDLVRVTRDQSASREDRLGAGTELARVGDPRAGVLTLEPAWCRVDAGVFVMGSAAEDSQAYPYERPQALVRLPAFRIARYPVTNGQWERFIDAGGYQDPRWWSADGWSTARSFAWTAPRFWREESSTRNRTNHPVVGVCWYEALAYCAWLSGELRYDVEVCTEAQWEKAARGTDGRIYPFGDELDLDAVHASDTEPPSTTAPVGCYPRGVSPYGVEDMVGNTYAWTTSRWGPVAVAPLFGYEYRPDDGREAIASNDYRVVRGGAWSFPLRHVRCAYRGKDRPADAFDNLGVRLVSRV